MRVDVLSVTLGLLGDILQGCVDGGPLRTVRRVNRRLFLWFWWLRRRGLGSTRVAPVNHREWGDIFPIKRGGATCVAFLLQTASDAALSRTV